MNNGLMQGLRRGFAAPADNHEAVVRSVAGLTHWHAADRIPGVVHGSGVALWPDASGNGYDVVQATAGNRPVFEESVFNGRPAVKFTSASSQFLQNTVANPFAAGAARTVFVAARNTGLGSSGGAFITYRLTTYHLSFSVYIDPSYLGAFAGNGVDISVNQISATINGLTETFGVACLRAVSGARTKLRINGANCTVSGAAMTTETGTTGFYIGRTGGGAYMGGHIAEIIAYAGQLSDDDCLKIERSLMARYIDVRQP